MKGHPHAELMIEYGKDSLEAAITHAKALISLTGEVE